ncbi:MAG: hypothetical protein NWS46_06195 [Cyclobacteriaceae bacterium]|jgi:tetratricopeptide (TPR) repeat protein|nr:hypothetical protein [Cyclobacteriaceae bacterium]
MKIIFTICLLSLFCSAIAQEVTDPKAVTSMDKGYEAMLDGKYEIADELLRYALQNIGKLPSQLAFYFGRNSYHLKKYKQSINWLNKYITLKGTSGVHFDESVQYLELANKEYLLVRDKEVEETEEILQTTTRIDCPGDRVHCPICKGTGVVISKGTFDLKYETCRYSGIEGILSCDEYNLFLHGQLKPKETE